MLCHLEFGARGYLDLITGRDGAVQPLDLQVSLEVRVQLALVEDAEAGAIGKLVH